jgi:YegS/Rv2252/BmrU family lipid kinase
MAMPTTIPAPITEADEQHDDADAALPTPGNGSSAPVTTETTPTRTTVEGVPAPPGWAEKGKADPQQKVVTVIFNPVSGQGDPEERKKRIEDALAEHGYRTQHLITTREQGARFFAEQALKEGVDLLAVSGGDGTVVEVASALIGTDVPLAIFPAGTGNLLSVNLNIPTEVPAGVHAALFGTKRSLDLARLRIQAPDGAEKEHFFAIIAGAGYDASVIRDADREAKDKLGMFAYAWAALKNLDKKPVRTTIRLDDNPTPLVRMAKSVMIANMGRLQGGVEIVPDADPQSGMLEVAVLKADSLAAWAGLAWSAVTSQLRDEKYIEYRRARRVEVEMTFPQPFQYDGEDVGLVTHFSAEVVPGAVKVMVPQDAPV